MTEKVGSGFSIKHQTAGGASTTSRKPTASSERASNMAQKDTIGLPERSVAPSGTVAVSPQKPEEAHKKTASKTFQVIGADPSRTVFSSHEFVSLQKTLCNEGQPLVLVQSAKTSGETEKFVLGSEQIKRYNQRKIALEDLLNLEVFLFYGKTANKPRGIRLSSIYERDEDIGLIDALLAVNSPDKPRLDVYSHEYIIASMLLESMLGDHDAQVAANILHSIPKAFQQAALDAAILDCVGKKGAAVAQHLLEWGASPNATDPDDELSILGGAIRRSDEAMIRVLIRHGADVKKETDMDLAAVDLVKTEPFAHLQPLFAELLDEPRPPKP